MQNSVPFSSAHYTIRTWLQEALAKQPIIYQNGTAIYTVPGRSDILLRVGAGERENKYKATIRDANGHYIPQDLPPDTKYLRPVTGVADTLEGGETLYRIQCPSDFKYQSQGTQEYNFSLIRYVPGENFEKLRERLVPNEEDEFGQLELLEKVATIPPAVWAPILKDIKTLLAAGYDFEMRGKNMHVIWPEDGDINKVTFAPLDYGTDCNPQFQKKNRHMRDFLPEKLSHAIFESIMYCGENSFMLSSGARNEIRRMEESAKHLQQNIEEAANQVGYPKNMQELEVLHGSEWSLRPGAKLKEQKKYIPTYRPLLLDAPSSLETLNQALDQRLSMPRERNIAGGLS